MPSAAMRWVARLVMVSPPNATDPRRTGVSPRMERMRVDLPAPLAPRMQVMRPGFLLDGYIVQHVRPVIAGGDAGDGRGGGRLRDGEFRSGSLRASEIGGLHLAVGDEGVERPLESSCRS